MIKKLRARQEARRRERERLAQLASYFRVPYWRLNHAIYLRVLDVLRLLTLGAEPARRGASRLDVKAVLFFHPAPGDEVLLGTEMVKKAFSALRVDGLIQRADLFRAESVAATYSLTLLGIEFLQRDWVIQTLATQPVIALPAELRRD
jgi:hypothetical protein